MAARQVLTVALRVMALWFMFWAIEASSTAIASMSVLLLPGVRESVSIPRVPILATTLIPIFVRFILGVGLLVYSSRIASRLYPELGEAGQQVKFGSVGAGDVYRIASFLLGVYVLLEAVRPAVHGFVALIQYERSRTIPVHAIPDLVVACVFVLAGLFLIFGARRVAEVFENVRYDPNTIPAQQFSLRLLLLVILICAALLGMIRYFALQST